mmetsp:Transcript_25930/g.43469  ORF Transcript_25930/g.43469 Transcript_25930/m.43469 type:complete len:207 (+) Transcript_25930:354-974(+)
MADGGRAVSLRHRGLWQGVLLRLRGGWYRRVRLRAHAVRHARPQAGYPFGEHRPHSRAIQSVAQAACGVLPGAVVRAPDAQLPHVLLGAGAGAGREGSARVDHPLRHHRQFHAEHGAVRAGQCQGVRRQIRHIQARFGRDGACNNGGVKRVAPRAAAGHWGGQRHSSLIRGDRTGHRAGREQKSAVDGLQCAQGEECGQAQSQAGR